jgi:separase
MRQAAYDAYIEAVKTYPFENSFTQLTETSGIKGIFDNPSHQQLASIIDRVTYLATNELLLAPAEVPLRIHHVSQAVVGALLEQQIESQAGSKWKTNVREVISHILTQALEVYEGREMPIRRSRVLVKLMEFSYHEAPEAVGTQGYLGRQAEEVLKEVRELLGQDVC